MKKKEKKKILDSLFRIDGLHIFVWHCQQNWSIYFFSIAFVVGSLVHVLGLGHGRFGYTSTYYSTGYSRFFFEIIFDIIGICYGYYVLTELSSRAVEREVIISRSADAYHFRAERRRTKNTTIDSRFLLFSGSCSTDARTLCTVAIYASFCRSFFSSFLHSTGEHIKKIYFQLACVTILPILNRNILQNKFYFIEWLLCSGKLNTISQY